MRVVQLIPGTGGTFYCQNCMRDSALVRGLRRHGVDVMLVPLYLPLKVDAEGIEDDLPVFFGGINAYLQQQFKLFRKTPRWLDRFFDARWMLDRAAAREGSMSASALGPMTLSMLQGRDGNQRKEVDRLVEWLGEHDTPDVIHASDSLLLGVATELKKALHAPLVCSLQDEHTWLDAIPAPYGPRCWEAMSEQARQVDAFIAVSEWYAGEMGRRMGIPPDKMNVVPVGIELDGIEPATAPPDPPVIGYLSRMSESMGLGLLVDAFIQLKQEPRLQDVRLRVTGGRTAEDVPFLERVQARIRERGFEGDVEFDAGFDKAGRHAFLRGLSVLSVPAPEGEAFGTFIIEALAFGVPVVQPAAGAFPEILEATGGGLLYDPGEVDGLAAALDALLSDPARAQELGRRGREAVAREYGVDKASERVWAVYKAVAGHDT
ncbi:MAG: glycosyltransferase family 4 protein [Candidatus Hydrogenedentes bacterium]|nr:glycosyltransferase family 4 protein [Candidatus Hydrogenedentota bacterium]